MALIILLRDYFDFDQHIIIQTLDGDSDSSIKSKLRLWVRSIVISSLEPLFCSLTS